ncbi:gluconokinase [Cellulomonas fulva]|nr:gluconokinase [Cellulomonas fulva]
MTHVVVMGVSGTGKTSVGRLVADALGRPFVEGDELHPPSNVERMRAGLPLTDADRAPWLVAIRDVLDQHARAGLDVVVACSALRRAYRDVLRQARGGVTFLHLVVPPDELARRMAARTGHFMPPALLASQLATLEPPTPDEGALVVPCGPTAEATATAALAALTGETPTRS